MLPRRAKPKAKVHPASPHLPHDLRHLAVVRLGVDRVRHLGRGVPEGQLGGLEPEGPPDLCRRIVPELVRVPAVGLLPRRQVGLCFGISRARQATTVSPSRRPSGGGGGKARSHARRIAT